MDSSLLPLRLLDRRKRFGSLQQMFVVPISLFHSWYADPEVLH